MQGTTKEDLQTVKSDLRALRDELRLKIHLGTMELKTEWERLEPQAEKLWNNLSEATMETAKDVKKRLLKLKAQLKA